MTVELQRMVITKVFDAPRDLVWQAWTGPNYVLQWWGPKDFTAPSCTIDLRPGGKFLLCMKSPDGQELWTGGEYLEIVPGERIVFSMYFANPAGDQVQPSEYGMEHKAIEGAHDIVTFEDLGNGQTRLTYVGNETMEEATKSGQVEGWNQILEKFAAVLAQRAKAS